MTPMQNGFTQALLDGAQTPPAGLVDPHGRPATKRFDVYRNNVAVSLTSALETGFPVIAKLVGAEFFKAMAGVFLRAHPPETPCIATYGTRFPGFLQSFKPVAHLPYLADVAKLELGLRQSYHAADSTPLDVQGLEPAAVMQLRPRMAPASLVLRSNYPVFSIWQANMTQDAPKVVMQPETVLITRPLFDPAPHLMPEGGFDLARSLKGRSTLSDAMAASLAACPQADLGAVLALFMTKSALTLDEGPQL